MRKWERARLGRIQPAPSPVGREAVRVTKRLDILARQNVAGEAPATAPEAGALPLNCILTA